MRWKWIAGILVVVIIVFMATVYVILASYDYNKFKPRIAQAVKDATGRELTLAGDISIDIGFSPALVVESVKLANAAWGSKPEMLEAEELQVQVELLPLFLGDVNFDRIGLTGVDVLLETDATGKGNWEFPAGGKSTKSFWAVRELEVENVRVAKLNLTFHDGKTGSTTRFGLDSLDGSREPSSDELTIDLKGTANEQPIAVSGKIGPIRNLLAHKPLEVDLLGQVSNARITIAGVIGDVLKLDGIDLKVHASGTDLAGLGRAGGTELPETDVFKMGGEVNGSTKALALQNVKGNVSRGSIDYTIKGNVSDLISLNGVDLEIEGSGKNLGELGPIIGEKLPKTGPFSVTGRLKGSREDLSLQDAHGSVDRNGLSLALNGKVKDLLAFRGMDFEFKGSGKDLAELDPILDMTLPKTGPFTVKGRLTGSTKMLSLRDAEGSVSRGTLKVVLNGDVKDLLALRGIDLGFKGSGKELADIGPLFGRKLPELGSFDVSGKLIGSTKVLSIRDARVSVSRNGLGLALNGKVKDLLAVSGIDLEFKGSGKDLAELGSIIGESLPQTGPFSVKGRLTGSTKMLSLKDTEGSVSRGTLKVALNGSIKDLLTLSGIDLKFKGSGEELAEIGPLIGAKLPNLGTVDVNGRLVGSMKVLKLDGLSAMVDKSDFNGFATVEFRKRPKITLTLESGLLDFTPLIGEARKEEKKVSKKGGYDKRLFSDDPLPFDVLKKVDADIVLTAKHIKAREAQFDLGRLTLMLEDTELGIDNLEAVYKGTKISGNIHINPGSPPEVATKFLVQNFDLGSFLREILADDKVEAHIDIAADLKGRGDSAHTLAADLDGTIGFVMGQGYLSKYLDLIATDLSEKVIPFWGSHKEHGHVNCAVVQFDTKKGLATSQAFVFDTAIQILTADGDINLETEKVNFLLIPKPKEPGLLNIATKLRVSGTIQHPKVRPDMVSLARKGVRSPGTLALGALKLLAPFVKLGAHQKHPCDIEKIAHQR